jgi:hypothetical protein
MPWASAFNDQFHLQFAILQPFQWQCCSRMRISRLGLALGLANAFVLVRACTCLGGAALWFSLRGPVRRPNISTLLSSVAEPVLYDPAMVGSTLLLPTHQPPNCKANYLKNSNYDKNLNGDKNPNDDKKSNHYRYR